MDEERRGDDVKALVKTSMRLALETRPRFFTGLNHGDLPRGNGFGWGSLWK